MSYIWIFFNLDVSIQTAELHHPDQRTDWRLFLAVTVASVIRTPVSYIASGVSFGVLYLAAIRGLAKLLSSCQPPGTVNLAEHETGLQAPAVFLLFTFSSNFLVDPVSERIWEFQIIFLVISTLFFQSCIKLSHSALDGLARTPLSVGSLWAHLTTLSVAAGLFVAPAYLGLTICSADSEYWRVLLVLGNVTNCCRAAASVIQYFVRLYHTFRGNASEFNEDLEFYKDTVLCMIMALIYFYTIVQVRKCCFFILLVFIPNFSIQGLREVWIGQLDSFKVLVFIFLEMMDSYQDFEKTLADCSRRLVSKILFSSLLSFEC